jgi:hypothetical protein
MSLKAEKTMSSKEDTLRGDEIRFVKGAYAGKLGWIDKSRMKKYKKSQFWPVIVSLDDGEEKRTRTIKSSVRYRVDKEPATYEEAIMQQHPDIEKKMIELAAMFAQCDVQDLKEAARIFREELTQAQAYQVALPRDKARWRTVEYDSSL